MRFLRTLTAVVVVGLAAIGADSLKDSTAHGAPPSGRRDFTVMTWNLYVGADLTRLFSFGSFNQLAQRGKQVYGQLNATNFPLRAKAIAKQIQFHKPHLVGLQEVALWRTQPFDGPISKATNVRYDFLEILQDELAARGQVYDVVRIYNGFDFEFPAALASGLTDVRFTDRQVVLVRRSSEYDIGNVRWRTYESLFDIWLGFLGEPEYRRGWISADVVSGNRKFRFISTHLDAFSGSVNEDQAVELLDRAVNSTSMPVVMVGDFNATTNDIRTDAYDLIRGAGFDDGWIEVNANAGATCCQSGSLKNVASELDKRIDYTFVRGAVQVKSAFRVGEAPGDKASNGRWPSDHAGVVVKVRLQ